MSEEQQQQHEQSSLNFHVWQNPWLFLMHFYNPHIIRPSVHHLVQLIWDQVKVTADPRGPSGIPMADIYDTATSPGWEEPKTPQRGGIPGASRRSQWMELRAPHHLPKTEHHPEVLKLDKLMNLATPQELVGENQNKINGKCSLGRVHHQITRLT